MAYIGVQPAAGQYRKLDDVSAGFNGTSTTFTTSVSGENVTAGTAQQLLVSVGGVIQEPKTDYDVSTNSIVFTTAPAAGLDFFAVLMGDAVNTITVPDGSVTTAKLAGSLSVGLAGGTNSAPTLFFTGDTNTGVYSPGADQVAVTTGGTQRLLIDASGNVNVDSNTLYVDAANNRVGVGTSSPSTLIHGAVSSGSAILRLENTANSGESSLQLFGKNSGGTVRTATIKYDNADYFRINTPAAVAIAFETSDTERLRITGAGLVGIGTSSPSSDGPLTLANAAETPTIFFSRPSGGSFSAAIQASSFGTLTFYNGAASSTVAGLTPRMTIDGQNGRVGIGSTAPTNSLEVVGGATSNLFAVKASSSGDCLGVTARSAGNGAIVSALNSAQSDYEPLEINGEIIYFQTRTGAGTVSERARIDSSGRLLVGTSSSRGTISASFPSLVQVETSAYAAYQAINNTNDATGAWLALGKSRGASAGGVTVVQNNDELGFIGFLGADGTDVNSIAAAITAQVDGTPGNNDMPGRLVFSTTADGAATPTERMRLDSAGSMVLASGTAFVAPYVYSTTTATAANVNVDATGFLRRSTSSIKYKTNVETIQDQYADAILGCRPVWYQSTCEADKPEWGHWGFIAEEVAEIDPRLCFFKEEEDGSLEPEGVQYDRFVPHLLNLIKRQSEAIAELQAEVAALKAQ